MTITDIAKEFGISRQTVYQRMKKAGVDVSTLVSNGQLTTEGVNRLRDILVGEPVRSVNRDAAAAADNGQKLTDTVKLLEMISDLQSQVR